MQSNILTHLVTTLSRPPFLLSQRTARDSASLYHAAELKREVMATLLHIAVSPREEASHSRKIGRELVERFRAVEPALRVVVCDLACSA